MDPHEIIKNPLATEKAVRLMEAENKLVFLVDRKANKFEIKKAAEELLKIRIDKVNTMITSGGKKKAYLTLNRENKALDVATKLGLM